MKTKSKCIGCNAIRLVNAMGLCKRCNRHAHDFISKEDMARLKKEREELLAATTAAKLAKKAEAEKKAEGEEAEPGEGEGEGEEEPGEAEADDSSGEGGAE
ncbi:hypothetical protein [[Eubacterium] cellulosolvens]